MQSTKQSPLYHPEGSVWNHTMLVIDEAAKRKKQSRNPSVFMWAALLHDIGKPSTTKIKKGKIISYKHDIAGAELAYNFLSAFTKDTHFINQVCSLIKYHMHILFVIKDLPFSDLEGLRKNANITEVALLGLCDRLGRTNANLAEEEKNIQLFLDKLNIKKERSSIMAKAGMKRPDPKEPHGTESNHKTHIPKNDTDPVPEIQGKAKSGKTKAKPI
ncbi:HDIG domain-containing protein [Sinanaerobacter sp. ZZT-01]|nr:HDIG domain-containing metalloprotein [Sinanaerobacter sp. ZZT-01]WRR95120.1 HDIG domain-containing protein [Sinanaerobacter sp. ZZT-01]